MPHTAGSPRKSEDDAKGAERLCHRINSLIFTDASQHGTTHGACTELIAIIQEHVPCVVQSRARHLLLDHLAHSFILDFSTTGFAASGCNAHQMRTYSHLFANDLSDADSVLLTRTRRRCSGSSSVLKGAFLRVTLLLLLTFPLRVLISTLWRSTSPWTSWRLGDGMAGQRTGLEAGRRTSRPVHDWGSHAVAANVAGLLIEISRFRRNVSAFPCPPRVHALPSAVMGHTIAVHDHWLLLCTAYTPTANQTCQDIVIAANVIFAPSTQSIIVTQFISFNPSLEAGGISFARHDGLSLFIRHLTR
ncbi:hypothetical protein B0H19DRAFT_1275757 [Mycena capillaripes]|nr:hypothetical protein B0H19DRAFT_1275757 [Mycena capillaripes]